MLAPNTHDHSGHAHAGGNPHIHVRRARTPAASLLRLSLGERLAGVAALILALWAGVFWAMG
jgi:hypothetical protein